MSTDTADRQQQKANEFLRLLPLTIELAGLPHSEHGSTSATPQPPQYRASAGFETPQAEQSMGLRKSWKDGQKLTAKRTGSKHQIRSLKRRIALCSRLDELWIVFEYTAHC